MRKSSKILTAALATGAVLGSAIAFRQHLVRAPVVTLYSEPHYQGIKKHFRFDGMAYDLGTTKLPQVGSIKIDKVELTDPLLETIYNAPGAFTMMRAEGATTREIAASMGNFALHLLRPSILLPQYSEEATTQTWIRLWADAPSKNTANDEQQWCDFFEDTPDVGDWVSRTTHVQPGILNPNPGFEDLRHPSGVNDDLANALPDRVVEAEK
ncbi:hypothetical protein [Haloglycomyces albus]|uniref:hypothetical protein n=1 Tax=Haloglycomyces albus TaxID=526067 RepID=UPI00046CB4C4|nr:hypothetical protein [Haloglycomyces albus]